MRYPFMPRNVFKRVKRSREKICFLLENATRQIIKRDEWEGTSSFLGCRINYEPIEMHAYEYRVFNNHKDQKNLRTPLTGVYIYIYVYAAFCVPVIEWRKWIAWNYYDYTKRAWREITDAYYLHHLRR